MISRKNSKQLKEILNRLDSIEQQSRIYNQFAVFSLFITMFIGLIAIYLAVKNIEIFYAGYILFIISSGVVGIMIGTIIKNKRRKKED